MIAKAVDTGGSAFDSPEDKGWLYGANFADLDGYLWNVIYGLGEYAERMINKYFCWKN